MITRQWRVRLGAVAEVEFANILKWTTESFDFTRVLSRCPEVSLHPRCRNCGSELLWLKLKSEVHRMPVGSIGLPHMITRAAADQQMSQQIGRRNPQVEFMRRHRNQHCLTPQCLVQCGKSIAKRANISRANPNVIVAEEISGLYLYGDISIAKGLGRALLNCNSKLHEIGAVREPQR
jgi:predicted ATPase